MRSKIRRMMIETRSKPQETALENQIVKPKPPKRESSVVPRVVSPEDQQALQRLASVPSEDCPPYLRDWQDQLRENKRREELKTAYFDPALVAQIDRAIEAAHEYLRKGGEERLRAYNSIAERITHYYTATPDEQQNFAWDPSLPPPPLRVQRKHKFKTHTYGHDLVNIYDPGANWAGVDALYDCEILPVSIIYTDRDRARLAQLRIKAKAATSSSKL